MEKLITNCRACIPVDKRIACALYTLGSSSELRMISHLFGIVQMLFYQFIKFRKEPDEIKETIDGFYSKCGYSMCIGALDGAHLSIKPPIGYETDYYNYKKYQSIIMLATVNSDSLFTYVNIGAPGKCNDSSVYNRSILSQVIDDPIYEKHFMMINNIKIVFQALHKKQLKRTKNNRSDDHKQ
ncbi:unnamed protein product [Adineta steineri]|uniref:DDE Tnp4 domain-containing protein n=1 Tax=Adineta steineri TaxID=433720 RepID=A0A819QYU2_9BILA|nr:unnamed protein product [Adineta steineri]CAF4036270.1 unnamed protein product [Adineta steineri]